MGALVCSNGVDVFWRAQCHCLHLTFNYCTKVNNFFAEGVVGILFFSIFQFWHFKLCQRKMKPRS